jgi:eukaryotic-like serine/threonine-protein kinase
VNAERWRRAEAIFQDAADLPAAEQAALLDRRCGDDEELRRLVAGLLAHDQPGNDVVGSVVGAAAAAWADAAPDLIGHRIGAYRVVDLIGHGGMGSVYRAVRDDEFTKDVAIKVVKRGMDSDAIVRRFRTERQILATLEHPNIARLLDGGTTDDGRPYFVMECIAGQPVTEYCRQRRLTVDDRLRLFRTICDAVEHAHRNLVIHRDLKPSNILVTDEGVPKLLDFGIAKLLGPDHVGPATMTLAEMRAFTPDYGSPEQVRGENVATTTDVYSLGAVLYEMLTGTRAHRFENYTPLAVEEAVCRTEVTPPSRAVSDHAIARQLRGDLDNIVSQALQKEPARRYQSVTALSEDIRRHLEHLPVQARPDTTLYRVRKFARRRRGLLVATAAVFVALAAGGVVALRQAQVARAREMQVRGLAKVFLFEVHDAIRDLPGATAARQTIVETAVQYLDALAGSNPAEVELLRELAAGYKRVADIQGSDMQGANLGRLDEALASYRKAAGFLDRLIAQSPTDRQARIDRVVVQRGIAEAEFGTGAGERAKASLLDAVDRARALLGTFPGDRDVRLLAGDLLMTVGQRDRTAGNLAASLATLTESLTVLDALAADRPRERAVLELIASGEAAIGMTQAQLNHLDEALAHYRKAVEVTEQLLAQNPTSVELRRTLIVNYSHVGDVLGNPELPNLGDAAGAERAFRMQVELARQLAASDRHDARARGDYAVALMRLALVTPVERIVEKQQLYTEARDEMQALVDESKSSIGLQGNLAAIERLLADALRDGGRPRDAVAHYRRAMDLSEPLIGRLGAPPRTFATAAADLAVLEARGGRDREALALLARARAVAEELAAQERGDDTVVGRALAARIYGRHAIVHAALRQRDEARRWRVRALEQWAALTASPAFTAPLRREMATFESLPID